MNFYRRHLTLINTLLFTLFLSGLTFTAIANSSGKTGSTQAGCTCHGSSSNNTTVTLTSGSGSFTVDPSSSTTFTVAINNSGKTNAGMNVGVKTSETGGSNIGTLSAGTGTKIQGGEVTHAGKQSLNGGKFSFTFDWKAPSEHGEYWIRGVANAVDNNGNASGDEWNKFTTQKITVAGVTVNAPNGGQNWCAGSTQNITWDSDGIINVKIEYSTNGGSNWNVITASTSASSGSFSWSIPNDITPGSSNQIRISDATKATLNDVSNNNFTIVGDVAITQQPVSNETCTGESFSLNVVVSGTGHQYQWRKNNINIGGATQATYTRNTAVLGDAADYDCVITTSCGNQLITNIATIQVSQSPSITSQPTSKAACDGESVTLETVVTGEVSTLQWRKNGQPISGANTSTYTIVSLKPADVGDYTLLVTSAKCGNEITSSVAKVSISKAPTIVEQPLSQTACEGQEITLSAQVDGIADGYQWYKDEAIISGAIAKNLVLSNLSSEDNGNYKLEITGTCGEKITSNNAKLTINTAPTISTQPTGKEVFVDESFTITLVAENPGGDANDLVYEWNKDGNVVSGQNESNFTVDKAALSDAGKYTVTVTNNCNMMVTSAEVEVKVLENNGGPAITANEDFLDFNEVPIGETKQESFTSIITNSGDETLVINSFTVEGEQAADFIVPELLVPISVEPNASIDITIEFVPSIVGLHKANLSFNSNSINNVSIELRGVGQDNRTLTSSVTGIDFGNIVVNEMMERKFTLTNSTTKDITILEIEGTTTDITTNITNVIKLSPSETFEVVVMFTPTELKDYNETLTIFLDDNNTIEIPITATAIMSSVWDGIPTLNSATTYPNPTQNNITIKLDFDKPEQYNIKILDVNGKVVKNFGGYSSEGVNNLDWNITDETNTRVSAGSYYAIIQVGENLQTIPIIIQ